MAIILSRNKITKLKRLRAMLEMTYVPFLLSYCKNCIIYFEQLSNTLFQSLRAGTRTRTKAKRTVGKPNKRKGNIPLGSLFFFLILLCWLQTILTWKLHFPELTNSTLMQSCVLGCDIWNGYKLTEICKILVRHCLVFWLPVHTYLKN